MYGIRIPPLWVCIFTGMLTVFAPTAVSARTAVLATVQGPVEKRDQAATYWDRAQLGATLADGDTVRTRDYGQAGILLDNRVQIRLGANSRMTFGGATQGRESKASLVLRNGLAWFRAKFLPQRLAVATPTATAAIRGTEWQLEVTEDGTSSVSVLAGEVELSNDAGEIVVGPGERGTAVPGAPPVKRVLTEFEQRIQWVTVYAVEPLRDIRVPAGTDAELQNAFSRLAEGDGEQALAQFDALERRGEAEELRRLGRAAALIHLQRFVDAQDLLDTEIARSPARAAAYLLRSQLSLLAGDFASAQSIAEDAVRRFPGNAAALSLLAKVHLLAGNVDESARIVDQALAVDPESTDALFLRGELAYLDGDYHRAQAAYRAASEADAAEDRGWYGLGKTYADVENVRKGRAALERAIALNPEGPGYHGTLASLLTLADEFGEAETEFQAALALDPNDYIALTGKGLMQLKRGETEAALESFLKATLLEPKYARAYLYSAVAYYQLERYEEALDASEEAKRYDPKDPLPGLVASMMQQDLFNAGASLDEALEALVLLPNLKSLNQLLNDRKGTANLGSAFAFFGLENWAISLGQQSYYPYWAGSHLFLSDRYTDEYLKNSELFQGFLADATTFGASNRYQTILPRPGSYVTGRLSGSVDENGETYGPRITLNGYRNASMPIAYFAEADGFDVSSDTSFKFPDGFEQSFDYDTRDYGVSGAIGARPVYELNLFGLVNFTTSESDAIFKSLDETFVDTLGLLNTINSASTFDGDLDEARGNFGAHYKFSPRSQLWARFSVSTSEFESLFTDRYTAVNELAGLLSAEKTSFDSDTDEMRLGFELRHTWTIQETWEWTNGFEVHNTQSDDYSVFRFISDELDLDFFPARFFFFGDFRSKIISEVDDTSYDGYTAFRTAKPLEFDFPGTIDVDLALFIQHSDFDFNERDIDNFTFGYRNLIEFTDPTEVQIDSDDHQFTRINPRAGLVYSFAPDRLLRVAYQRWTRPNAAATLSPVSTAGITLDTRLTQNRGTIEQIRVQGEFGFDDRLFAMAYYEHEEISNKTDPSFINVLDRDPRLQRLRNRINVNLANESLLEFSPQFSQGEIDSFRVALDGVLRETWSASAAYIYRDTEVQGTLNGDRVFSGLDNRGNDIPGLPEHTVTIGTSYISPRHFTLDAAVVYRSDRFFDEANLIEIDSSWDLTVRGFWESRNKRFALDGRLFAVLDGKDTHYLFDDSVEEASEIGAAFEFIVRY